MDEAAHGLDESFDFVTFTKEEIANVAREMQEKGAAYVKAYMEGKLNAWRAQPLNIAITGASGVGKSSFTNTVRGVAPDDEKFAAPVGVKQTTMVPTPYEDPLNRNLKYWDLPGVGTAEFPKDDTYLTKVNFERYDFFLIFSAFRFREEDIWLAKKIQAAGKKFFFIRGKIDVDIKNEKDDHPSSFNEQRLLDDLKQSTTNELKVRGFNNPKVFLLSNKKKTKWDFPALCEALVSESEGLKKEAMVLSLGGFSKELVNHKASILRDRIKWISALSAMGAAIPIPGVSLAADVGIISMEYMFYKKQLHLDDESLSTLGKTVSSKKRDLLEDIRRGRMMQMNNYDTVLAFIKGWAKSIAVEEASRLIVGIGTVIASGISYATTMAMLTNILDKLTENAILVFKIVADD